jgi:hypothetical protein
LLLLDLNVGSVVAKPSVQKPDESPEAITLRAMDAMNAGKYEEFAKDMHPEALRKFRSLMSTIVDLADQDGKAQDILRLFPNCKTVADTKKLDDVGFFATCLEGQMRAQAGLKEAMANAKNVMIGRVDEKPDMAHVLYNMTINLDGEKTEVGPNVVSFKKDGERWAMMLKAEMENGVAMMLARMKKGKIEVPERKSSKIQPFGRVLVGDETVHVVYRVITPVGEKEMTKMNVLSLKKDEPGWQVAKDFDSEAIIKLIKEKFDL